MKSKVIAILSNWLGKIVSLIKNTNGSIYVGEGIGILVLRKSALRRLKEIEKFEINLNDIRKLDDGYKMKIFDRILLVVLDDKTGNLSWLDLRGINRINGRCPFLVFLEKFGDLKRKYSKYKKEVDGEEVEIIRERDVWDVEYIKGKGLKIDDRIFRMKKKEEWVREEENVELEYLEVA